MSPYFLAGRYPSLSKMKLLHETFYYPLLHTGKNARNKQTTIASVLYKQLLI